MLESRKTKRARCLRLASILVEGGPEEIAVIADFSNRGLRLRSAYKAFVCEKILLRFADGEVRRGIVAWIAGGQIGIEMDIPKIN